MIKHGVPKSVREIANQSTVSQREKVAESSSVRTVGRLKSIESVETVVIEDNGCELEVDVSLSSPCQFKPGSVYQFIGEVEDRRNSLDASVHLVLLARIARNVDGLDAELYERGLRAQQQCLEEMRKDSEGAGQQTPNIWNAPG